MENTGESEDRGEKEKGVGWAASTLYRLAAIPATAEALPSVFGRGEKYGASQSGTVADARILRDLT